MEEEEKEKEEERRGPQMSAELCPSQQKLHWARGYGVGKRMAGLRLLLLQLAHWPWPVAILLMGIVVGRGGRPLGGRGQPFFPSHFLMILGGGGASAYGLERLLEFR
jgi:hypothetical protein